MADIYDLFGFDEDEDIEAILEGVDWTPVDSSNLAAVGYDKKQHILFISFLDGSIYSYDGVPPEEVTGLMKADSHGEYFYDNIRLVYPYERLAG
jgi:hypothetical protein